MNTQTFNLSKQIQLQKNKQKICHGKDDFKSIKTQVISQQSIIIKYASCCIYISQHLKYIKHDGGKKKGVSIENNWSLIIYLNLTQVKSNSKQEILTSNLYS